jgi:hypothetical protein
MKVQNMTSKRTGRAIPNQYIITDEGRGANGNFIWRRVFQSYDSIIVEITQWPDRKDVNLDENRWDYSTTTGKYRNQFLGETKKETEKKIKSGEYQLVDFDAGINKPY